MGPLTRAIAAAATATMMVAACSVAPVRDERGVRGTWIELGPGGAAIARAITGSDACPDIVVDGNAKAMSVRVKAGTAPLRPTVNPPADSKPSSFPVTVCEFNVPAGSTRASVGGRSLPLPKSEPQRIVVIGDSGCRLQGTYSAWQACDDADAWPFAKIAATAAGLRPDLVIHVGDYHYRETACPPANASCRGSPWGYGWDAWDADLFTPAAMLLGAAPWIVVRGNHEECARAGQGWFRFLDPYPFDPRRSCDDPALDGDGNYTPTYSVPIGGATQAIVFDSAKAGYQPLAENDPQFIAYRAQFEQARALATASGTTSIFVNHHPLLGFAAQRDAPPFPGTASLQSVASTLFGTTYFPAGVALALHGHMHDFQAIAFAGAQPPTLVVGIGGDLLDLELPSPYPRVPAPAPGVTVATMAHAARFGFVLMERRRSDWAVTAFLADGSVLTRCAWSGARLDCEPTGLLGR